MWPDQSSFAGYYFEGQKHGKGKIQFCDGSTYEGDLEHNEIKGFGIYKWPDGKYYEG